MMNLRELKRKQIDSQILKLNAKNMYDKQIMLLLTMLVQLLVRNDVYAQDGINQAIDSIRVFREIPEVFIEQETKISEGNGLLNIHCVLTNKTRQNFIVLPSHVYLAAGGSILLGLDEEMSANVNIRKDLQKLPEPNCLLSGVYFAEAIVHDTADNLQFIELHRDSTVEVIYKIFLGDSNKVHPLQRYAYECLSNSANCYAGSNVSFPCWSTLEPLFAQKKININRRRSYTFEGNLSGTLMKPQITLYSSSKLSAQDYIALQKSMLRVLSKEKQQYVELQKSK